MYIDRRDGYRVVVGGPVPPQADAITLGRTIVMRSRAAGHQGLLAHELVHVRQFRELGPLRFVARYLGAYLRARINGHSHMAAYRRIPLEVEASWQSRLSAVSDLEQPLAAHRGSKTAQRPPSSPRTVARLAKTAAVGVR